MENRILHIPKGFTFGSIPSGVRKNEKHDLAIIYSEVDAVVSGVFTQNKAKAAPVLVCIDNLSNETHRGIVVNSGNANACTGDRGMKDALDIVDKTAEFLKCSSKQILCSSTGVISTFLPVHKILNNIDRIELSKDKFIDVAEAIKTTDTIRKTSSTTINIGGEEITIAGMTKGSGMIHPNMATTLAYILTDAKINKQLLQSITNEIVEDTFNMITVDGDTSTNDSLFIIANGVSGIEITEEDKEYKKFYKALYDVILELAKLIVVDGEGATKFATISVSGADTKEDARTIAKSICTSSLVKTALFGSDANVGRILSAIGNSQGNIQMDKIDIHIKSNVGDLYIYKNGELEEYEDDFANLIFKEHDIDFNIFLNVGEESATAYTCDLSYDYVRINGDYRS